MTAPRGGDTTRVEGISFYRTPTGFDVCDRCGAMVGPEWRWRDAHVVWHDEIEEMWDEAISAQVGNTTVWALLSMGTETGDLIGVFTSAERAMAQRATPTEWEPDEDGYKNTHGGFWIVRPYPLDRGER